MVKHGNIKSTGGIFLAFVLGSMIHASFFLSHISHVAILRHVFVSYAILHICICLQIKTFQC